MALLWQDIRPPVYRELVSHWQIIKHSTRPWLCQPAGSAECLSREEPSTDIADKSANCGDGTVDGMRQQQ